MLEIDVELVEGEPPKVLVNKEEVPVVYLNYRYVTDKDRYGENVLQGTIVINNKEINFYKDMKTGRVKRF